MSIPEFIPPLMVLGCALFPPSSFWVRLLIILLAISLEFAIFKYNFGGDRQAYVDSVPAYSSDPSRNSYAENYPD